MFNHEMNVLTFKYYLTLVAERLLAVDILICHFEYFES